jgi:dienelactone hydrolase
VVCAFVIAASGAESQTLEVGRQWATLDQPVTIRVRGLQPGQSATVRTLSRDRSYREWQAHAEFRADSAGSVDLAHDAPIGGSYRGVAPMGLFQFMEVTGPDRRTARFEAIWSDTIATEIALEVDRRIVARDTLRRTFASSDVRVTEIRQDGMVGTRFSPGTSHPRAHVLVLGGSEGGVSSADVAAQLATDGFDAMAVGYFGADSLPSQLSQIPLEYFGRALRILAGDHEEPSAPVAILGTSKGAEAALLAAVEYPVVRAVVAYAPSSVAWSCICDSTAQSSWTWRGYPVPVVPPGRDPNYRPSPGSPLRPVINYAFRLRENPTSDAVIPIERTGARILLIAGADDAMWPSADMAEAIRLRRTRLGDRSPVEILLYQSAGHLIGKSYLPAGSTLIALGRIETGGTPEGNAHAQADSWPKVVEFLSNLKWR